jgi:type II secretory pathway pseudopilin PulG
MTTVYLILAGLAVVVALALLYGRQSRKRGRAEANAEGLKSAIDHARKAGTIDEDTARMSDADLYDELHGDGRQ